MAAHTILICASNTDTTSTWPEVWPIYTTFLHDDASYNSKIIIMIDIITFELCIYLTCVCVCMCQISWTSHGIVSTFVVVIFSFDMTYDMQFFWLFFCVITTNNMILLRSILIVYSRCMTLTTMMEINVNVDEWNQI